MYDKVVIIGYGKIVGEILTIMYERRKEYGYELSCIEYEQMPFSVTQKKCEEENIPFFRFSDRRDVKAYLMDLQDKTLVVSAGNNFLFPKSVVAKKNLTIINFHSALLPNLPGRNAPSWAIYYGEKETGATWHYVTEEIDAGKILIQKTCPIGDDIKAYQLTEQIMDLAAEGFREIVDRLLRTEEIPVKENPRGKHRLILSSEVPGDGKADLTKSGEELYRLLRAVDYGKNDIFPTLEAMVEDRPVLLMRYKKVPREKTGRMDDLTIDKESKMIYKYYNEENEVRIKYKEKEE